jgi:DNA-binding winged helix-turn-helix (wHTH) protein
MQQTGSPAAALRFGVFEVDLRTGELTKRGIRLRLQEQPFRLLTILLEKPGELVTREELRARLWPQTWVDFDHGLNKAISKIRQALGHSAENPRFIETVVGRGYRFLANVTIVENERPEPVATELAVRADPPPLRLVEADTPAPRRRDRVPGSSMVPARRSRSWGFSILGDALRRRFAPWRCSPWTICLAIPRRITSPTG